MARRVCLQSANLIGRQALRAVISCEGGAIKSEQTPIGSDPHITVGTAAHMTHRQVREAIGWRVTPEAVLLRHGIAVPAQQKDQRPCAALRDAASGDRL